MRDEPGEEDKTAGLREVFDMTIPADPKAMSMVTDAADSALSRLHIPEQKRLELGLALQEALANAIIHGCNNDPSKQVHCSCRCDSNGRILVVVTDPGAGFRWDRPSDPKTGQKLYADHGRGVYLIRQLTDEVQFEGGGNQIKMWKY